MPPPSATGDVKSRRRLGLGLIALGVLANPWVLGMLLAPDGSLDGEARIALVFLFDVFCALSGLALAWSRPAVWFRDFIPNKIVGTIAIGAVSAAIIGTWWGISGYRGAHHHTMDMSHMEPPTAEQRQWADDFVGRCWDSARRHGWFNFETAKADGFELQWSDREHYVKHDFVFDDKILDPDRPEFLMYRETPRGNVLLGFMFFTRKIEERGPQPGGSLTPWHYHPWNGRGYCAEGGILPVSRPDDQGHCGRGERVSRSAEMLHVWFVDHPLGPYADAMLFPDSSTVVEPTMIHPMVVHFAIALVLVAVFLDLLGVVARRPSLHGAAFINLIGAGVFSIAAVAAGMVAEVRLLIAPDVHQILDTHKLLGFSSCAGILVLLGWRVARRGAFPARAAGVVYLTLSLLIAVAIGTAGFIGSQLVYGNGLAVNAIDRQALERLERAIPGGTSQLDPGLATPRTHVHGH